MFGKVAHHHFLWWFTCVLACSRCSDAFALDPVLKRKGRLLEDSPIYGAPRRCSWLILGIFYFFAGYWKWMYGGIDWAISNNLVRYLVEYWHEYQWTPLILVHEVRILPNLFAAGSVIIELLFVFALFSQKLRNYWIAGGFFLHSGIAAFMGINFWNLQLCYAMFINWRKLVFCKKCNHITLGAEPGSNSMQPASAGSKGLYPLWCVSSLIMFTQILAGFLDFPSWPISTSPHYGYLSPAIIHRLEVEIEVPGHPTLVLNEHDFQAYFPELTIRAVLARADQSRRIEILRQLIEQGATKDPRWKQAKSLRVYHVTRKRTPDFPDLPLISRDEISELPLRSSN